MTYRLTLRYYLLYIYSDNKITSEKRMLMTYNHQGIRFSFTPIARDDITFGVYDINDGDWYYIMVTWVKATGLLEVRVNAVLVATRTLYARGDDLPA